MATLVKCHKNFHHFYLVCAPSNTINNEVLQQRFWPKAMSAARDVVQGQKRAVGVAKRPREISSDQARCQKAIFLEKGEKS